MNYFPQQAEAKSLVRDQFCAWMCHLQLWAQKSGKISAGLMS